MEINLSNRLRVKPLKEGEVKIFVLCNAGKPDPNLKDQDGKVLNAYPGGGTYQGYFTIYDPYEPDKRNAKKIIKNVTGSTTVIKDGKEILEEVVSPIEFNSKGVCVVKHDQYNTLVCLTRADENESNPYRRRSVPALWRELETVNKAMEDIISASDLAFEAESIARKCDIRDAQAIVKKLYSEKLIKHPSYSDPKDLRYALTEVARSHPKEFIRSSKDKELKIKLQISDAIRMRFLDLNENEEWVWQEKNGTDSILVKVDVSKDPYDSLIEYILSNKEFATKLSQHVDEQLETPVAV